MNKQQKHGATPLPGLRTQIGKNLKLVLNDTLKKPSELYKDKEAILSLKLTHIPFLAKNYEFKFSDIVSDLFRRERDYR